SKNGFLRQWSVDNDPNNRRGKDKTKYRLPGLKHLRTDWLIDVAGGPTRFTSSKEQNPHDHLNLQLVHCPLKISDAEFAQVGQVLETVLIEFRVAAEDRKTVLAEFRLHQEEVTFGHYHQERCAPSKRQSRF